MRRIRLTVAVLALGITPRLAVAQPQLTGATLFHATSTGENDLPDAIDLGQFRGSWRTDEGLANQYAGLFLSTAPDAAFSPAAVLNASQPWQAPLLPGANMFYFYSSGWDRLGRPDWGLNLWLDGAGAPPACVGGPWISALVAPGAGQTAVANGAATTTTRCPSPPYVAGANTLSFVSGGFTVTLTDFEVLAESDVGSGIDRVGQTSVGPDGLADTYGQFTLQVSPTVATSEPATYALVGSGLVLVGVLRRRTRR